MRTEDLVTRHYVGVHVRERAEVGVAVGHRGHAVDDNEGAAGGSMRDVAQDSTDVVRPPRHVGGVGERRRDGAVVDDVEIVVVVRPPPPPYLRPDARGEVRPRGHVGVVVVRVDDDVITRRDREGVGQLAQKRRGVGAQRRRVSLGGPYQRPQSAYRALFVASPDHLAVAMREGPSDGAEDRVGDLGTAAALEKYSGETRIGGTTVVFATVVAPTVVVAKVGKVRPRSAGDAISLLP